MKKIIPLFVIMITICGLRLLTSEAKAIDKDWVLDPKTSTLIPKYLGKVKVLNGKAVIGDRELKKGSKIYNNELIQTSPKSYAVIEMIDLTTVTIGPNTDFKVENWDYRTKNDREAVFLVLKGQWRAHIKSKSKDDDQLKIKTKLVSMGVRGTELLVNVDTVGDKEINQVALLEGNIHLSGDLPKDTKTDMVAGDYTVIEKEANETKHKDKILTPDELKSFKDFSAPDVYRLLDPIAMNDSSTLNTNKHSPDQSSSEVLQKEKFNSKTPAPKSLKENLELLNSTRERNLKSK